MDGNYSDQGDRKKPEPQSWGSSLSGMAYNALAVVTEAGQAQVKRMGNATVKEAKKRTAYKTFTTNGEISPKDTPHHLLVNTGTYHIIRNFESPNNPLSNLQIISSTNDPFHIYEQLGNYVLPFAQLDFQNCDFTNANFLTIRMLNANGVAENGDKLRQTIASSHKAKHKNTGLEAAFFSVDDVLARYEKSWNLADKKLGQKDVDLAVKITKSAVELFKYKDANSYILGNTDVKKEKLHEHVVTFIGKGVGKDAFLKAVGITPEQFDLASQRLAKQKVIAYQRAELEARAAAERETIARQENERAAATRRAEEQAQQQQDAARKQAEEAAQRKSAEEAVARANAQKQELARQQVELERVKAELAKAEAERLKKSIVAPAAQRVTPPPAILEDAAKPKQNVANSNAMSPTPAPSPETSPEQKQKAPAAVEKSGFAERIRRSQEQDVLQEKTPTEVAIETLSSWKGQAREVLQEKRGEAVTIIAQAKLDKAGESTRLKPKLVEATKGYIEQSGVNQKKLEESVKQEMQKLQKAASVSK